MTVERGDECIWIGKRRIVYFASRTRRVEKEVNFSSSCSADYQHWTYLSPVSLPFFSLDIVRSSTTIRSELNTRRIWSFYLGSSRLLLILTRIYIYIYNDLDYWKNNSIHLFDILLIDRLFQCLWYVLIS
jgi:hypothetical protein